MISVMHLSEKHDHGYPGGAAILAGLQLSNLLLLTYGVIFIEDW